LGHSYPHPEGLTLNAHTAKLALLLFSLAWLGIDFVRKLPAPEPVQSVSVPRYEDLPLEVRNIQYRRGIPIQPGRDPQDLSGELRREPGRAPDDFRENVKFQP
jgi:hypothetical protein